MAGLTIRTELLGVTSLVRALGLHQRFYDNLLDNFHSTGIKDCKGAKVAADIWVTNLYAVTNDDNLVCAVRNSVDGHAMLDEAAQRQQQFYTTNNASNSTIGDGGLAVCAN